VSAYSIITKKFDGMGNTEGAASEKPQEGNFVFYLSIQGLAFV
jgi:hypothetical protein